MWGGPFAPCGDVVPGLLVRDQVEQAVAAQPEALLARLNDASGALDVVVDNHRGVGTGVDAQAPQCLLAGEQRVGGGLERRPRRQTLEKDQEFIGQLSEGTKTCRSGVATVF